MACRNSSFKRITATPSDAEQLRPCQQAMRKWRRNFIHTQPATQIHDKFTGARVTVYERLDTGWRWPIWPVVRCRWLKLPAFPSCRFCLDFRGHWHVKPALSASISGHWIGLGIVWGMIACNRLSRRHCTPLDGGSKPSDGRQTTSIYYVYHATG